MPNICPSGGDFGIHKSKKKGREKEERKIGKQEEKDGKLNSK